MVSEGKRISMPAKLKNLWIYFKTITINELPGSLEIIALAWQT